MITGYKWELYNVEEDPTEFNDLAAKMPEKVKQMQDIFYAEAKKFDVLPLDNYVASSLERAEAEPDGGTNGLHLLGSTDRCAQQRRSEHPEQVVHHYRRGRDPQRWCGRDDRHRRRALRWLRAFPEQGRGREFGRGKPVFLYNLLDLKRTTWAGPALGAGKHTIVFDFKSDGPGLGKGGTGVLSVDGKEVAKNSMEHTTPITFPEDETFDIGQDTRTGVAMLEYRYDVPFKFTGKIDKLTFNLGPEQMTAKEREEMQKARAQARDEL